MRKAKPVTLTIKEDVLEKGKTKALKQHRSFSNYVEWLILNDCKGRESETYN